MKNIKRLLPHKYPLLLIDCVEEIIPKKRLIAKKNYTYNEWFFPVHYEDDPKVPASILIESMSQAMTLCMISGENEDLIADGLKPDIVKIDNYSGYDKVKPGDSIELMVEIRKFKRGIAFGYVECLKDKNIVCCVDFTMVFPKMINLYKPL